MAGYIPRRFTCPRAVTHPSINRAQCRLTALIELNGLTTTLRRLLKIRVQSLDLLYLTPPPRWNPREYPRRIYFIFLETIESSAYILPLVWVYIRSIFTAPQHMLSAVSAIVNPSVRLSVCPSVRLSDAGTVSKRLKLRSWGLHCLSLIHI